MVELEGLVIGVTGKLALWESLRAAVGEAVDGIDFAELAERAGDQRARLERAARARRRRGLQRRLTRLRRSSAKARRASAGSA